MRVSCDTIYQMITPPPFDAYLRNLVAPDEAATQGVLRYNREAHAAPDLLTVILPLRDGVSVSLKL